MKFDKLKNLIDLGGVRLVNGLHTRHGLIFRAGAMNSLSDDDCARLSDGLGVHTIIDLRTNLELEERPDVKVPGTNYVHIPMFTESVFGISKERGSDIGTYVKHTWNRKAILAAIPDMMGIYSSVMTDRQIVDRIGEAMHLVINNVIEGRPTLFHCSQGKDRTGVLASLLLLLLGGDRETVLAEYERGGRVNRIKAVVEFILVSIFKLDPKAALDIYHAELAEKRFIASSLDTIDRVYGSTDALFRDCLGISDELRGKFRAAMCE